MFTYVHKILVATQTMCCQSPETLTIALVPKGSKESLRRKKKTPVIFCYRTFFPGSCFPVQSCKARKTNMVRNCDSNHLKIPLLQMLLTLVQTWINPKLFERMNSTWSGGEKTTSGSDAGAPQPFLYSCFLSFLSPVRVRSWLPFRTRDKPANYWENCPPQNCTNWCSKGNQVTESRTCWNLYVWQNETGIWIRRQTICQEKK